MPLQTMYHNSNPPALHSSPSQPTRPHTHTHPHPLAKPISQCTHPCKVRLRPPGSSCPPTCTARPACAPFALILGSFPPSLAAPESPRPMPSPLPIMRSTFFPVRSRRPFPSPRKNPRFPLPPPRSPHPPLGPCQQSWPRRPAQLLLAALPTFQACQGLPPFLRFLPPPLLLQTLTRIPSNPSPTRTLWPCSSSRTLRHLLHAQGAAHTRLNCPTPTVAPSVPAPPSSHTPRLQGAPVPSLLQLQVLPLLLASQSHKQPPRHSHSSHHPRHSRPLWPSRH